MLSVFIFILLIILVDNLCHFLWSGGGGIYSYKMWIWLYLCPIQINERERKRHDLYLIMYIFLWTDECRSEATFRYTVENISKLKETALSPPCMVRNLPWYVYHSHIFLKKIIHVYQRKPFQKTVCYFILLSVIFKNSIVFFFFLNQENHVPTKTWQWETQPENHGLLPAV